MGTCPSDFKPKLLLFPHTIVVYHEKFRTQKECFCKSWDEYHWYIDNMKNEYSNAMSNNPSLSDQRNQISLIHLFKRFCICKVANVEAFGMAIMHHRRQLCTSAMRGEIFQIFEFCTYDIVIQIGSNSFNYQSLLACSSCYKDIGCS